MKTKLRNISFSPPDMGEAEINEVRNAILSGWITTGPRTKDFEKQISNYCNTEKSVCLNSATACMEMALRVIGVGPGDEVIVPSYTYTATASVTQHVGAKLVLVDSQKECVEMDYDMVADAITEKTKVIMPVDLGGIVANYDQILKVVEIKKGLFKPSNEIQKAFGRIIILADAAHAIGAHWHGKMCGEIADFTALSFHAVKNLTTAEGGALVWRNIQGIENEKLYHSMQLYSLHGQNKDALTKNMQGAWEYDIIGPWYKCNMTDIIASIGLAQFKRYPQMLVRRKEIIEKYNKGLENCNVALLNHWGPNHMSSMHLYLVRLLGKNSKERNEVIIKMAKRGIACNVHYKPLPMMTAYKSLGYDIKDFPNAYHLYENEVTLPLHTSLSDEDVEYVITNFVDIINH
ncbi:MAG: DegT/DnrJ/EryC1/StrS family aminotransferase [Bacteroidales bacterium]|nr:DegT/DnrJ/EryC1/StrS family aminotransferase [Bacteroidales bacterium]